MQQPRMANLTINRNRNLYDYIYARETLCILMECSVCFYTIGIIG